MYYVIDRVCMFNKDDLQDIDQLVRKNAILKWRIVLTIRVVQHDFFCCFFLFLKSNPDQKVFALISVLVNKKLHK